jgi:hypothetical protein
MYITNANTTGGITNFNNSTLCSSGGYGDFHGSQIASQIQGGNISLSLTNNNIYPMGASVWIDYNDNGVFTDAGENVATNTYATGTYTLNFTVPLTAPAGTHRMRIMEDYFTIPSNPCGPLSYGETEDYGFTVIVPTPCSGTPNPGNTLSSVTPPVCSSTSFTLTLQNAGTLGSGISYQWQSSPDNITWTNIAGATSNSYTSAQTSSTYYYCNVTCAGSGLSAVSSSYYMIQNAPTNCYCTPTVANTGNCTYDWIGNVTLGTINNTSGCTAPFILYPATGTTTTNLVVGSTNAISLSDVNYSGYFDVFIDFNQDGIFQTSERVVTDFMVGPSGSSFGSYTGTTNITIPGTAMAGSTRMRVRYDYFYTAYNGLGAEDPCAQLYEGETEDYIVNIIPLPATPANPVEVGTPSCSTGGTIQEVGSAPSGETWYWQTTATGTSTASPASTPLTIFVNGTYYINSYNATYNLWSAGVGSVTVTDFPAGPSSPPSPTAGQNPICAGGGTTLTEAAAPGGVSFYWEGTNPTGTSTANNASSSYSLSAAGTYYVMAQDNTTGCWSSLAGNIVITSTLTPTINALTATPASICVGSTSQLSVNASLGAPVSPSYNVATITYNHITPVTPTTVFAAGSGWDDAFSSPITIPFSFNYYGNTYTSLVIETNGYVELGAGDGANSYGEVIPNTATPNNKISGVHNDLIDGGSGSISYFVTGATPNRIFTIEYLNCVTYGSAGSNYSVQIDLYETSNIIEVHVASANGSASDGSGKTIGVENATGTAATFPIGRNGANGSWNIVAGSPEAYQFYVPNPASLTYSWSPSGSLNDATIYNPVATLSSSSQTYTLTVTATGSSCSTTGTVTISNTAVAAGALTTGGATSCVGTQTVTAHPSNGTVPYTYAWTEDGSPFAGTTATITSSSGTHTYVCTINDACGTSASSSLSVTTNALASVTPTTLGLCAGNSAIATASPSGGTYSWTGGLGTNQTATITTTGSYTVTVTQGTCVTTAVTTATVTSLPTITAGSNSPVCVGTALNLTSTGTITQPIEPSYSVSSIAYNHITPVSPTTVFAAGSGWDDAFSSSITIPFSFNYYGTTYTSLVIETNGYVELGAGDGTNSYGEIIPNTFAPNNKISGVHNDLVDGGSGSISYFVTGTSPNRIFTIEYLNCGAFGSGGSNYSTQIDLYETSNIVEVHVASASGSASDGSGKTIGVENSTGTSATFPAGRNGANGSWNINAGSPESYRFSIIPINGTYAWTGPNSFSVQNPSISSSALTDSGTYTVTFTDPFGCTASTAVATTVNPLPVGSASGTGVTGTGPYALTICSGAFTGITLNSDIASSFSWSGSLTSGSTTGFTPSGSGASINDLLTGAGTVTYTITPTANGTSCSGTPFTVVVTVNALPVGTSTPSSATFCSGGTTSFVLSGGSTYTWTVTGASGSSACASGCASTIAQTLTDASHSANATVNYAITPISALGCVGSVFHAIATVRPSPNFTGGPAYSYLCSGSTNNINLTSSVSSTYTWTTSASAGITGNTACSSGCVSPIHQTITNGGTTTGYVTYAITPTSTFGCVGTTATVADSVGAIPTSSVTGPSVLCSGDTYSPTLTTTTAGAVFTWASTVTSGTVTGNSTCGGGCGALSDVLVNTGTTPATVQYTISISTASCSGTDQIVNVTVNPGTGITCPGNISVSNDAGVCGAIVNFSASATGTSSVVTYSQNPGTLFPIGTTTVTATATGSCGAPSSCTFTVTVNDNEAPVLTCAATANLTTDAGLCTSSASTGAATATDNCPGVTVTSSPAGPFAVGSTTVTWTATDANGNTATCSQTINVTDAEAPVITCPATATLNTDAGMCTASSSIGTATATDNCSVSSVTVDNSGPYSVGSTTVTWTATDVNGNTSTCSQTVNVTDAEAPVITCPATANLTADAGLCTSSASAGTTNATDNCSISTITASNAGPYSVGSTTVIWTATDANGNTATCSQIINVTDTEAPVLTCAATANITTDAGLCTSSASTGAATATDNCAGVTVTGAPAGPYSIGSTTVTWTATDASGNTATCTQIINVTDAEAPMITCPATANLTTDAGLCTSSESIGTATATDNCSVSTLVSSNAGPYSVGTTTVIWTATDANGNTATCSQTVIVTDNQAPTITAPAAVSVCSGTLFSIGTATGSDNCGTPTITNNAPSSFPIGTTVVIWTATDASGNTATASQNVTMNATPTGSASPASLTICDGSSVNVNLNSSIAGGTFSWTAANTSGTVIGFNNCSSGCGTTITDVLSNLAGYGGIVQYAVTPSATGGCSGAPFTVTVTVATVPTPPVLSGPFAACGLGSAIFTATSSYATTYTWTTPAGITITSGAGTSAIHCSLAGFTNPGNITCTTSNACGSSVTTTQLVSKKPAPPAFISGPTSVCGLTSATYSVLPCAAATSYTWTLPAGMTITAGTGTTQITVSIVATSVLGNMRCDAVNACGFVTGPLLFITGHAPATPGTLTGPTNVCGFTTGTYSIPAVAYATGYTWTVPSWMTITGGAGTTSITVSATGTPAAGTVSVAGTDACGTGTARTVNLVTTAVLPGAITGPTNICGVTSAAYSIASLGAGYTYSWTLSMTGWSITSGAGTTAITCSGPATGTTASGLVKVTSTNSCGSTSGLRTLAVTYCHSAIANNSSNDQSNNMFSTLYPNPTTGEFKIDVTTDLDEEMTIQVYDVLGNLIISEKHQVVSGTSTLNTNLESYKNGMYFVRLVDSKASTVYSQTVIKQ